jgi:hypothetical protein
MDMLVVCATDESRAQSLRQPLKRLGITWANAPSAAQHQGHRGVWGQFVFQNGKPLKQGMVRGLVWAHVDTLAGMPEYLLMVDYAIKVQVQDHIRAARCRCRYIGRIVDRSHRMCVIHKGSCQAKSVVDGCALGPCYQAPSSHSGATGRRIPGRPS